MGNIYGFMATVQHQQKPPFMFTEIQLIKSCTIINLTEMLLESPLLEIKF